MIYCDTKSTDIYYNLACELYFASEKILPDDVFLMWRTSPTIVIGKYQNALEEIDGAYVREHGVTVARRLSGGGTVYMDMGGWQFSWITRTPDEEIDFARFVDPVAEVLRSYGADARLSGRNDITVGGRKISGNAQYRLGEMTVHHGTLLFDTDLEAMALATRPKAYKFTSKAIASVRERVVNIRSVLPPAYASLTAEEFRRAVVGRLTGETVALTPEDEERIRALSDERFRDERVIWAASPRFEMEKDVRTEGGTFRVGLTVRKGRIEEAGIEGDFFGKPETAEAMAAALRGTEFTPNAVRQALAPFEASLFRVTAEDLARGIFE